MKNYIFNNKIIYLSKDLPITYMNLDGWSIICVTGLDKKKYLNGQFTIDINMISHDNYKFGAHCNINGKVWTSFLIFQYKHFFIYIVRSSVCKRHIHELKKYSLFSKVNIFEEKKFCLFGLCGLNSSKLLENFFSIKLNKKKSVLVIQNIIILKINKPIERFLIIAYKKYLVDLLRFINCKAKYSNGMQWLELDIESCFPIMNKEIMGHFILQSLDLKKWDAINFNKGCYYGQEILCKYENKKINKFIICSVIGKSNNYNATYIFEPIEYKDISGNRCNAGMVLSWVHIYKKKILLQVRMKKNFFKKENVFFLSSHQDINFKIYNI
ncbi:tRNA-modifying protein YgfZ [Buchnera aphidicola]|uniref:tRNA-modifying protein YgfZ n=1 Tax=Buchnera aphidicola TaxID=9 RepID=UPI0010780808|nr:tRNA-modifying protein YgfZ [Buchnera aphidicola]VFP79279.1 tRNA-modifying protein YgfZ [Buchnera aphidicola (Cinara curtihirsuta)]